MHACISVLCLLTDTICFHMQLGARPMESSSGLNALTVDQAFEAFFDEAEECANEPVPHLKYRGGRTKVDTKLPTLIVEGSWKSARPTTMDDITLCTNTGWDRYWMWGSCMVGGYIGDYKSIIFRVCPPLAQRLCFVYG